MNQSEKLGKGFHEYFGADKQQKKDIEIRKK